MDLAEALCMPLAHIRALPEEEFQAWCTRGVPLWPRRLELMLMQLTAVLHNCHAQNPARMGEFDLFKRQDAETEAAVQFMTEATGAGICRLGQGRKGK